MFSFDDQFYSLYGTTAEREGGLIMSSQEYARRFIPPEEASIVAEETSKALATTDPNFTSQVEHRIIRADGTEGVIAVRFGIIKDSKGRTIKTYGANQDITERKKVEEELRQNRDRLEERVRERTSEMERFIYTVSHDLRSPLVTVSGFLGQLKEDLEEGDSQRAVTDLITISEAITKMDCLLLDTLELSRIGRVANPPEEASFGQIVQEALRQTEERIKSLDVAIYVAGDMPKVRVDVPRIEEVLVNLLENSVKYMGDQASPEIDIGSRKDGGETVFFVKDNGIGIDPGEHEKVFGLFYKVNKKSEGTGVGLAIVKRIIEVLGGRIWIESELEKGCTVCFTLPLANV
jgi:signal transduction histidine kinase